MFKTICAGHVTHVLFLTVFIYHTMNNNRLYYLLDKYFEKSHTAEEKAELLMMLSNADNEEITKQWIGEALSKDLPYEMNPSTEQEILQAILQVKPLGKITGEKPVHSNGPINRPRVRFLANNWLRYAAAVVIIIAGAGYFFMSSPGKKQGVAVLETSPQKNIEPGSDRAALILSNGKIVMLDSVSNGELALENNARIVKKNDGEVEYQLFERTESLPQPSNVNTMKTPRGGQYRLVLPDGTKVWLNAASSITFPTVFTGYQRNVRITGEAYFEVIKDASKPFIVDIDENTAVQVIGTSFNINAYPNDAFASTTLIEGKVKVLVNKGAHAITLEPGERVNTAGNGILKVDKNIDAEEDIAWKKGFFQFTSTPLSKIMKQLERWYDVEFNYSDSSLATSPYTGNISRNAGISQVLNMLTRAGNIRFKIDNKKISVMK